MKKSIICLILAAGMAASCDPIKEEKNFDINSRTASEIESCFTFTQADADGNAAADGNYFTFTTSPATQVTVFNLLSDGSENQLARGTSGTFVIKPKRGSDTNQKFWVRVVSSDGKAVDVEKTANVYVQQELDPEIRLLASDAYGSKVWKWDTSITGAVWGNMGYCGGAGADVGLTGNGQWWGVTTSEEFDGQRQHTHNGINNGDGNLDAYMVFTDEGIATTYDASGKQIRTAPFAVEGWDASAEWRKGLLKTTAILWPYEINSNGNVPGEYEIVYLTPDKMTLVYPDGGAYSGLGSWGEATFWHFTSTSDVEGMAFGYGNDSKDWTWDYDGTNTVWGNMGYCGGNGADVGTAHNGQWWGVVTEEDFAGQVQHSNTGALNGDEGPNAYFTLSGEGTITRHASDGSVLKSGTFEIDTSVASEWKVADLKTTAGTILWPFEINSGGNMPTQFEVVYLNGSKMCLVYPGGGAFDGLGGWGEATYWHFKAK